jgi:phosphoenolpyruvate carboxykinase (ATP)
MELIMAKIDLKQYGINGVTEVIHNPSYEDLYKDEMNPALEGYEKVTGK